MPAAAATARGGRRGRHARSGQPALAAVRARLEVCRVRLVCEQEVLRLDVAVHDAQRVQVRDLRAGQGAARGGKLVSSGPLASAHQSSPASSSWCYTWGFTHVPLCGHARG